MAVHPYALRLETDLPADDLLETLRQWEPWAHRIEFSNGVSTADLQRRVLFNDNPLEKLARVQDALDLPSSRHVLDIGCNSGYNAIHLAARYGMQAVGIDVVRRHLGAARFLAGIAGVDAEFLQESAERFVRPGAFDLVLHFGTLYHLENPLLSLRNARECLRPGGWLALETQVYDGDDPNLVYFMHLQNDDPTNFWALSTPVLHTLLRRFGFGEITECVRARPPSMTEGMSRLVLVAKAGS